MSIEVNKAIGFETEEVKALCTDRDAILYSLGIGYSSDPMNAEELTYTYELHEDFKVFPTYTTCLHRTDIFKALTSCPGIPNFNPMMLLHGEQRIQVLRPLKAGVEYVTKGKIANISDKGKGALIQFDLLSSEIDAQGKKTLAFVNTLSLFIRGLGGFGHKGNPVENIPATPKRPPCKEVKQVTTPNQAIIYRLSGDINPLHIDPNMAALGGFDKPILHGLCTYGICAKAAIQTFTQGNGDTLKSMAARFTSHVFPGETLLISLWKDGTKVQFSAKTQERGIEVIVGFVEFNEKAKL
ncbi:unnamed protein product [Paramecium primaurelia]|uniref:MaoC-like domain-containing protein n=1 Tax=Paramecium primaurelia TaxID=5886 RepID=A0A8S1JZS5_PARPR|nr:unnamed protein product [Paramecium primaurelia]